MKLKLKQMNQFPQGYLTAAFWTNDEHAPSGCDYSQTDRPEAMFERLSQDELLKACRDCRHFQDQQAGHLRIGGLSDFKAGTDFWLTRNGHGAGFWDGDWPETQGEALTEASKAFGEVDLYAGDDGQLYFTP
jgi:hypothetical protein